MIRRREQFTASSKLISQLAANFSKAGLGGKDYVLGLSGGIDSTVLLHAILEGKLVEKDNLQVVHINHGLSKNALLWEEFCRKTCCDLKVKFASHRVSVIKQGGQSLENQARICRIEIFSQMTPQVILLAHHEQDQLETMLTQVLRGSDLHNVAGMKLKSAGRKGKIIFRPLLNVAKKDIIGYATFYQLKFVEDESNLDSSYLRNFIRNKVWPLIKEYNPQTAPKLLTFIRRLQEHLELFDEFTQRDLEANLSNTHTNRLDAVSFSGLSNLRQLNLLGFYLKKNGFWFLPQKLLEEFLKQQQGKINFVFDLDPATVLVKKNNQIYLQSNAIK